MTADQYKSAADAISNYRWMLAAALGTANLGDTKQGTAKMIELQKLRDALEAECIAKGNV